VKAPASCRAAARRGATPRVVLAIALSSCTAVASAAQETTDAPGSLVVSSTLERIAAPPAGDAAASVPIAPGTVASHVDQIIVTVRFTNLGEDVVDSIRITSPVPADVQYVPHSASGPGSEVLFSVDSGRSFGRPDELTLAAPDGGVRDADASDYTHVRWVLRAPLDAGATGIARFRAVPR
jgi:uncharacterized repeat protein (TIGR01451 family)